MGLTRSIPRLTAKPITIEEFNAAFRSIWLPQISRDSQSEKPEVSRCGIAVSGGADSMALAFLCKQLSTEKSNLNLKFRPIVVDHGVRRGSRDEAERVREILKEEMDLNASVISLNWSSTSAPSKLTNFESRARRLRYRALATHCLKENATSLFTGHHGDDQAETVLLRMMEGRLGRGLKCIESRVPIPEVYDMYGIYKSGLLGQRRIPRNSNYIKLDENSHYHQDQISAEGGGTILYRPLLEFSKERLYATCQHYNIPWFEDETNADPTLTPRNAVRELLRNDRLPLALRVPSLMAIAKVSKIQATRADDRGEIHFNKSDIHNFDLRSGRLVIQFHEVMQTLEDIQEAGLQSLRRESAALIRRVVSLISPQNKIDLSRMSFATDCIFPELSLDEKEKQPGFTIAGAFFRLLNVDESKFKDGLKTGSRSKTAHLQSRLWEVSRQPLYPNERGQCKSLTFDSNLDRQDVPIWSTMILWDGRFWISVLGTPAKLLSTKIRHFQPSDLKPFIKNLGGGNERRSCFRHVLQHAAPEGIRWTLPAIVNQDGKVIALPTLDFCLKLECEGLKWDVRYKAVDLGRHRLGYS